VSRPPILLVEDTPDDALLMRRAFDRCRTGYELVVAGTGEEATGLLFPSRGRNEAPLRPSLVLLDLDLPGSDGIEVLRRIRTRTGTRTIPVIVLTSSRVPADVAACYELGANSYLQKPVGFDSLLETIETLTRYWLGMNVSPVVFG
jgi:CheY-like chemotaxis protein